jgi:hypothetical protein
MQRSLFAIASLSTLLLASSAYAVTSIPNGWYLEGNAGITKQNDKSYGTGSNTNSSGIGANINLGYKFMPFMALEAGYTRYSDTTVKNNAGVKAFRDRHYTADIAVKGILPVASSGFEAFAKLGYHRTKSDINIDDSAAAAALGYTKQTGRFGKGAYIGLGGQYYFMPELAMVVQWQRAKSNSSIGTMNFFSAGLSFIFE